MPFTGIDTYLIALFIAVLSGVVMSGIPGGGLIGEMLIVSLYNFPASAFPIIATIAWLVDPPATCLNDKWCVQKGGCYERKIFIIDEWIL